jgi:FMN-dependent NADH-azoreductase
MEISISRELSAEFTRAWKIAHPQGKVIRRDLGALAPRPLDQAWIQASFTDTASLTPAQREILGESDTLIAELEDADEVVIGVAMHNFAIPSALKLWIDQVVRRGRTFSYSAGGPTGMLTGKKATVLSASGGTYESGTPSGAMNFMDPYLKAVLSFIGIGDIAFVTAGGASQLMRGSLTREEFMRPTLERVRAIAA